MLFSKAMLPFLVITTLTACGGNSNGDENKAATTTDKSSLVSETEINDGLVTSEINTDDSSINSESSTSESSLEPVIIADEKIETSPVIDNLEYDKSALDNISSHSVRLIYAIPSDRSLNTSYAANIKAATIDVQRWYSEQLGGKTFELYSQEAEVCYMAENSEYYAEDSWGKVVDSLQACVDVSYNHPDYIWIVYADVLHKCNTPGRLGAGTTGLTILPRQDLLGLDGVNPVSDDCGKEWYNEKTRWLGGLGHELGHAFGLAHPRGCDDALSDQTCDGKALMWLGYIDYPHTYLRQPEREFLLNHPAIN